MGSSFLYSHSLPRAMAKNALIDYMTPVMSSVWDRNVGPENPQPVLSDAGLDSRLRQADFRTDALIPPAQFDPDVGKQVDLLA